MGSLHFDHESNSMTFWNNKSIFHSLVKYFWPKPHENPNYFEQYYKYFVCEPGGCILFNLILEKADYSNPQYHMNQIEIMALIKAGITGFLVTGEGLDLHFQFSWISNQATELCRTKVEDYKISPSLCIRWNVDYAPQKYASYFICTQAAHLIIQGCQSFPSLDLRPRSMANILSPILDLSCVMGCQAELDPSHHWTVSNIVFANVF